VAEAEGLLAGELAVPWVPVLEELLDELPPEEQAARVALRDRAHRIPATDRVFRFIYWSFLLGGYRFQ
jgi:hypothetical protein